MLKSKHHLFILYLCALSLPSFSSLLLSLRSPLSFSPSPSPPLFSLPSPPSPSFLLSPLWLPAAVKFHEVRGEGGRREGFSMSGRYRIQYRTRGRHTYHAVGLGWRVRYFSAQSASPVSSTVDKPFQLLKTRTSPPRSILRWNSEVNRRIYLDRIGNKLGVSEVRSIFLNVIR